jgi:transcription initiation factor IIF auxiliary subunit
VAKLLSTKSRYKVSKLQQPKVELVPTLASKNSIRLAFGNHSEINIELSDKKIIRLDSIKQAAEQILPLPLHRWAVFLTINNDDMLTLKYIRSVTYHVHRNFSQRILTVYEPPFLLSRVSIGTFPVVCKINF